MKVIEKPTYQCDFCKKRMLVKHAMIKHEENCYSNPKNQSKCSGCVHLEEIEITYTNIFDREQKSKGFKCTAKNIELYPFKCIKNGMVDNYPEQFHDKELMPTECILFEEDLPF